LMEKLPLSFVEKLGWARRAKWRERISFILKWESEYRPFF